jgi:hypothetical protein
MTVTKNWQIFKKMHSGANKIPFDEILADNISLLSFYYFSTFMYLTLIFQKRSTITLFCRKGFVQ